MRKRIVYIIIGVGCLLMMGILSFVRCGETEDTTAEPAVPVDTMMILVQQVRECSRLYTAEVDVHKIITHGDEVKMNGSLFSKPISIDLPLGERKIAIPIDATLKAYIDFSQFSTANVERMGDKIEIVLPDPKVVMTQTKVRNEDIKKRVPLLRSNFTDKELTTYEHQGREQIIGMIPKMNIIPMAQEGAANVLIPLLEQLGYKEEDITITFRKEFTLSELKRMIE